MRKNHISINIYPKKGASHAIKSNTHNRADLRHKQPEQQPPGR